MKGSSVSLQETCQLKWKSDTAYHISPFVCARSTNLITHSCDKVVKKPIHLHRLWMTSVQFSSVQFSRSVVFNSLRPHESQHARPPCPSPTLGVYSNSCPSSRWCHPAISSSVVPFSSCLQSLPASGTFPMSQLFAWGGQSIVIVSIKIKNAHAPLYIIFIPNNYFYKYTCTWGQQNVDKDIHHSSTVLTSQSLGTTKMSNIDRLFKKLWYQSTMDILTEWGDFVLCYEMVHTTYWYNLCSKPV